MSQGNINSGLVLRKDRNLSDVVAQEITIHGSLGIRSGNLKLAGQGFNTVVGYAPTTFATAVATTVLPLNNRPNLPAETTPLGSVADAAATTLILPAGAVITRAFATNNGTTVVGGTDFDIGQSATAATADNIFGALTSANLNFGASVGGGQGTAIAAMNFDAAGEGLDEPLPFASLADGGLGAAASFVTVTVNTNPNTAGDLKVVLEYVQL